MKKERLYWIDVAKGISMLLIVLGHVVTWKEAQIYVNAINFFHVPIWIFLSALFLKPSEAFGTFIKKKASRLLKPYYIYGALIMLIHVYDTNGYINIFLGGRKAGAIWFLPLLFSTTLIAYFILKLRFGWQIISCIAGILTSLFFTNTHIILPLNLDIAFYMLLFIVIACHYREFILQHIYRWQITLISAILIIIATVLSITICPKIICNFFSSQLGILPITVLLGFMGIYSVCWIAQQLAIRKSSLRSFLLFIGQNSIIFIVLHQNLCYNLLPLHHLSFLHPGIVDMIAFIVVISFCCVASIIINKHFQFTIS